MNKYPIVLGLLFTLCISIINAQDAKIEQLEEVVVTDSRFNIKRENSGKTVIKITQQDLERNQGSSLSQIINTKSGITINGANSVAGQSLGTFIRGGQNRQVLVLIDGIAINDASQIENNFDLNLIPLDQIESIEILKGASSVLYGNRASTAVINITLKKATKESVNASFSSFLGTNNSQDDSGLDIADFSNAVALRGKLKSLNYSMSFSNTYTDGLSAIKPENGQTSIQSDPFSKYNTRLGLSYKFTNAFSLSTSASLDNYRNSYDDGFGFVDAENTSYNELKRFTISPKYKYKNGEFQINVGYNETSREYDSSFSAKYKSSSFVLDAFNKFTFNEKLYTILGVNYVKTDMESFSIPFGESSFSKNISANDANDQIVDPYINATYISDFGLNLNAGIRLNNHSEYGSNLVYNFNPSYVIKSDKNTIKILSSISTAYITPSLFQLFDPLYGNDNLQPQQDRTIEGGFSFEFSDILDFTAVYFNRDQQDFIDYVILDQTTFSGEYQNVDVDFKVQGLEIELQYYPTKKLTLNTNYTFTERIDDRLFRIPKHKINASLNWQLKSKTNLEFSYQFNSDRTSPFLDDTFSFNRNLSAFSLINLNANQVIIKDKLKVFVSFHNILNEDYEELYRFSTRGRNYRFGFNLTF